MEPYCKTLEQAKTNCCLANAESQDEARMGLYTRQKGQQLRCSHPLVGPEKVELPGASITARPADSAMVGTSEDPSKGSS